MSWGGSRVGCARNSSVPFNDKGFWNRSEGVADAEQRSELFEDAACRIVRSRNDLLPGEGSEIVPEFRPQEHVRDETELHASADAEDHFPYIIRSEAGDLRNRLRARLRTGDHIFQIGRAHG